MSFKDMVARDIRKTFLNLDEFAEKCTVRYDGVVYKDITASLQDVSESDRQQRKMDDYAQGLHRATTIFICAAEDIGGGHLCKDHVLEVIRRADGKRYRQKYTIVSCTCEMGMVDAELEEVIAR